MLAFLTGCAFITDTEHQQFVDADGDGYFSSAFSDGNGGSCGSR